MKPIANSHPTASASSRWTSTPLNSRCFAVLVFVALAMSTALLGSVGWSGEASAGNRAAPVVAQADSAQVVQP